MDVQHRSETTLISAVCLSHQEPAEAFVFVGNAERGACKFLLTCAGEAIVAHVVGDSALNACCAYEFLDLAFVQMLLALDGWCEIRCCGRQRAHCIHTPGLNFPTSFGSLYVPHSQSQYMKRWPKFDLNSAWWT